MVETLCTSGLVKIYAGEGASSTITTSGLLITQFINGSEGDICAESRVNWIDLYSTLNVDFKQVLESACAAKSAIKIVRYSTKGYLDSGEAGFIVNVLWAEYDRAMRIIKDTAVSTFLGGTPGE